MPLPIPQYTVVLGTSLQTTVPITLAQAAAATICWNFVDSDGEPVPLEGKIICLTAWQSADGGETKQILFTLGNGSGESGIAVVGDDDNGVQVSFSADNTANLINEWARYDIASIDDDQVIASGPLSIAPAFQ